MKREPQDEHPIGALVLALAFGAITLSVWLLVYFTIFILFSIPSSRQRLLILARVM